MDQGQVPHASLPIIIAVLGVIGVLAWRLRRMSQTRPLKLESLWRTPAIFIALGAATLFAQPPQGLGWAWITLSLLVGAALGWWRGTLIQISVDPESHALNTRVSPAGVIFIVAVVAARFALRGVVLEQASNLHVPLKLITGVFMVFAVGLMVVQRAEMYLRATRLLREAQAGPPARHAAQRPS